MTEYRIIAEPRAERDVEAAINWYEGERPGLGLEFLTELRAVYARILAGRSDIRCNGQIFDEPFSGASRMPSSSRWRTMSSS